jgi:hypothetical protein
MADLIDGRREDIPADRRLRLSIQWRHLVSEPSLALELDSELSVGLFIGDAPLFSQGVYRKRKEGSASASQQPGYFYGEDNGCALLHGLWRVLQTDELIDFEDYLKPFFRLVISSSGALLDPVDKGSGWMDVLVIIQHDGAWRSNAMGASGPALCLSAERKDLTRFFHDLLDKALLANDELSRTALLESFDGALTQHHQLLQA